MGDELYNMSRSVRDVLTIMRGDLKNLSFKKNPNSPFPTPQSLLAAFGKSAPKVYHSGSFNLRSFNLQRLQIAESLALLV